MPEWTGKIRRVELGAGGWELVLPGGERFELYGSVNPSQEGKTVVVRGTLVDNHGFLMTGSPAIEVDDIRNQD